MRSCLLLWCCLACVKSAAPVASPAPSAVVAGKCTPPLRHYPFKAIAGVSMGAVGPSRLVAAHPERFDAAGFLGGPLDATLLLHTMETAHLGGSCSPDQLEKALALDLADGGNRLDRQGYLRECARGSFYVNRRGLTLADNTRYGDALLELMDLVDSRYRTLKPADGPAY